MRKDIDRLHDMLEAIRAIERYSANDYERFFTNEMLRVWYLKHIEIIGEASARLSSGIRERYPDIPWRDIIGMRNMLIHGYFDIDWNAVWQVVQRDIPVIKPKILEVIDKEQ